MSAKPLLLDLFCGPGGAGYGYGLAGFEVVGCDISPQPHNPHEWYQDDAMRVLDRLLDGKSWQGYRLSDFQMLRASPPCQEYSQSRHLRNAISKYGVKLAPKLIVPVRERFVLSGLPWEIENVPGAPLPDALQLCGSMFGLPIRRHRWFASSHYLYAPGPCRHETYCINVIGAKVRGYGLYASSTVYRDAKGALRKRESYLSRAVGCAAMGIDWMSVAEMAQAIPPVYTEWLGKQFLALLESSSVACRERKLDNET